MLVKAVGWPTCQLPIKHDFFSESPWLGIWHQRTDSNAFWSSFELESCFIFNLKLLRQNSCDDDGNGDGCDDENDNLLQDQKNSYLS